MAQCAIIEANNWSDILLIMGKYSQKHLDVQYCVICMFAIEMYLKSIYLYNERFPREFGHNIKNMYNGLNDEEKKILKKDVKIDNNKQFIDWTFDKYVTFDTFEEELEFIENDFENLRYEFEKSVYDIPIITCKEFIKKLLENSEKLARWVVYGDKL